MRICVRHIGRKYGYYTTRYYPDPVAYYNQIWPDPQNLSRLLWLNHTGCSETRSGHLPWDRLWCMTLWHHAWTIIAHLQLCREGRWQSTAGRFRQSIMWHSVARCVLTDEAITQRDTFIWTFCNTQYVRNLQTHKNTIRNIGLYYCLLLLLNISVFLLFSFYTFLVVGSVR